MIFLISLITLYGLMWLLNRNYGLAGQAWAGMLPAMLLLAMQLYLIVGSNLLDGRKAAVGWLSGAMLSVVCGGLWYGMFHVI